MNRAFIALGRPLLSVLYFLVCSMSFPDCAVFFNNGKFSALVSRLVPERQGPQIYDFDFMPYNKDLCIKHQLFVPISLQALHQK